MKHVQVSGYLLAVFFSVSSLAQPVFHKKEVVNGIVIYPDLKNSQLHYYEPGALEIAKDNFGVPELKFVQLRYTGTQATGDKGKLNFRSLLQFSLRMRNIPADKLRETKEKLASMTHANVDLRPLNIRKINAHLIYASIDDSGKLKDKPSKLTGGNMEAVAEAEENSVWQERTFTVSLDNYFSQIFWSTLDKGQTVITLAFSFFAEGILDAPPIQVIDIPNDMASVVTDELKTDSTFGAESDSVRLAIFKADAFGINVDTKKNPGLVRKIDINEAFIPPDFAVLDVRCYDFNNNLREDLFAKRIEIEATGMNGDVVKDKRTFYSTAPDIYYAGIRFKYAVRMDKPFRYRVVEIKNDIAPVYGAWINEKNWNKIIDITTKI